MRSLSVDLAFAVALVVLPATPLLAGPQQIRQKDGTPFERPRHIAAIASTSNGETVAQLQGFLTVKGYTVVSVDRGSGELLAIKRDSPSSAMSDRVLIWLERDPGRPTERAYVYFLFGRFEPFVGSTEGPVRVRLYDHELARMTGLQEAIMAFANSR